MQRRAFLKQSMACVSAPLLGAPWSALSQERPQPSAMTVTGKRASTELGIMLPHEHVMVDFIGADRVNPERYDPEEVFTVMLPYLKKVRELGCRTIAECTPAYLGRDPALLKRLCEASGVTLLTNTGYYAAAGGKYLPGHALRETADQLAGRWTREFETGIADTEIRPGFIKIGVDGGPLTEVNRKLVQAAARCHRMTGLTIAAHTGDGAAALEQLEVLRAEGVSPGGWIWVHAQSERDTDIHRRVAALGAWVEFDGVGPQSLERHVQLVSVMKEAELLGRVLVSHDAGWYSVGQRRGGEVRSYDTLFTQFLPQLKRVGFTDDEVVQLTVRNPAKAFSMALRAETAPNS